jgi:hypothetical protein
MIFLRRAGLACPYFVPREIVNDGSWMHPARLPLGAGWSGTCCASSQENTPSQLELHEFCNLGNATRCSRLPRERDWDAVRFSVARASLEKIELMYVCELAHAPVEHGRLAFDRVANGWLNQHADARVQRLADSYLETYRARQDDKLSVSEAVAS